MLSKRYTFQSEKLKYGYIEGKVDYQTYLSSLEDIKKEELSSVVFDYNHRLVEEEIAAFESQQLSGAKQEKVAKQEKDRALQIEAKLKREKEDVKMKVETLEEKLLKARSQFYENEAPKIIITYNKDSRKYRTWHNRLQTTIIVCSALTTAVTSSTIFTDNTNISLSLKIIAAVLSIVVAIASGSIAHYKFKERSNDIQETVDKIDGDYNALKLGTGEYKGKSVSDSLSIFAENTNHTIAEHKKKQLLLDQPPDAKLNKLSQ